MRYRIDDTLPSTHSTIIANKLVNHAREVIKRAYDRNKYLLNV